MIPSMDTDNPNCEAVLIDNPAPRQRERLREASPDTAQEDLTDTLLPACTESDDETFIPNIIPPAIDADPPLLKYPKVDKKDPMTVLPREDTPPIPAIASAQETDALTVTSEPRLRLEENDAPAVEDTLPRRHKILSKKLELETNSDPRMLFDPLNIA